MSPRDFLAAGIRLLCGARLLPAGALPTGPAIFFANHSSHLDFVIIWACVPPTLRATVRPVAGRDYWTRTSVHRWVAQRVFNAVLIERHRITVANNPLEPMLAALDAGSSLIVFPEGTRSADGSVAGFKAGIHHLAKARPGVPLVPVHLENLNRILPKGQVVPVPLIATLRCGAPLRLETGEDREAFLARARAAVLALLPPDSP